MVLNHKTIPIPIVLIGFSFVVELLANTVSFFTLTIAKYLFWIGMSIAGFLIFLDLTALFHTFVNEHFTTAIKKVKQHQQLIQEERKKIEKLIKIEMSDTEALRDHLEELDASKFSAEALLPYLAEWHRHYGEVHHALLQENHDLIMEEVKSLQLEKRKLEASEEKIENDKRTTFLEQTQDQSYVYTENLTEQQQQLLSLAEFEKTYQWDIIEKCSKEMMIKSKHHEGVSHVYLVGAIKNYLKENNVPVETYDTKLPDLIFNVDGQEWAIEVETGSLYRKNQKALKEKVETNNRKYPQRWFFVVTNKHLTPKYNTFGDTVDRNSVIEKINTIIHTP